MARGSGLHTLGGEQILHADRHAAHGAQILAPGALGIGRIGRRQRMVGRGHDKGIEVGRFGDGGVESFRHFARGKAAAGYAIADRLDAEFG